MTTVKPSYTEDRTVPSTALVERCVLMCTDPGDLVLDPTCGSGTTASEAVKEFETVAG